MPVGLEVYDERGNLIYDNHTSLVRVLGTFSPRTRNHEEVITWVEKRRHRLRSSTHHTHTRTKTSMRIQIDKSHIGGGTLFAAISVTQEENVGELNIDHQNRTIYGKPNVHGFYGVY